MSPEQQKQLKDLQMQVDQIKQATYTSFVSEMSRRLMGILFTMEDGASTTGTTISVRNSADTGSELVADDYDGVLTLTDNKGNSYRIGYYS